MSLVWFSYFIEIFPSIYKSNHSVATEYNTIDSSVSSATQSCIGSSVSSLQDVTLDVSHGNVFAVFVSFVEVYNEYVYDLLEMSSKHMFKRKSMALGEDRNGIVYIKGLAEIRIHSPQEALKVLEVGRRNLHFATTKLNHNSSRSHCIFTIKVVRLMDAEDANVCRVSMLSICDLAGAERAHKTQGSQERLKEAGNINTSLLTLNRCIVALRHNQLLKDGKKWPVPYRDSKLTRIFQTFFMGMGKAAMIVNVAKTPLLFDETLQVLKFSAIAQQVSICQTRDYNKSVCGPPRRASQFSRYLNQRKSMHLNSTGRLSVPWENNAIFSDMKFGNATAECETSQESSLEVVEEEEEEEDERYEYYVQVIAKMREQLVKMNKEKCELEVNLRKELCDEFTQQIAEIEASWRDRLVRQEKRWEEHNEVRINALMNAYESPNRKRARADSSNDDEQVPLIQFVREQIKLEQRDAQISDLESELNSLKEEKSTLEKTLKLSDDSVNVALQENTRLTFQLALLTNNLDIKTEQLVQSQKELSDLRCSLDTQIGGLAIEELHRQIEESKKTAEEKFNEIKKLTGLLEEAAEDFILKETECNVLKEKHQAGVMALQEQGLCIAQMRSELVDVQQELSQRSAFIEERDLRLLELQEALSNSQNQNCDLDELQKKIKQLESEKSELDNILKELKDAKETNEKSIVELKHQIETVTKDNHDNKKENTDLRQRVNAAVNDLTKLNATHEETVNEMNKIISNAESAHDQLILEINNLKNEKDLLEFHSKTEQTIWEDKAEMLKLKLDESVKKVESLMSQEILLKGSICDDQRQIAELMSTIRKKEEIEQNLKQTIKNSEEERKKFIENENVNNFEYDTRLKKLETEIRDLHLQLIDKEITISATTSKVEALDRKLNIAESELENSMKINKEMKEMKLKQEVLQKELDAVKECRDEERKLNQIEIKRVEAAAEAEISALQVELKKEIHPVTENSNSDFSILNEKLRSIDLLFEIDRLKQNLQESESKVLQLTQNLNLISQNKKAVLNESVAPNVLTTTCPARRRTNRSSVIPGTPQQLSFDDELFEDAVDVTPTPYTARVRKSHRKATNRKTSFKESDEEILNDDNWKPFPVPLRSTSRRGSRRGRKTQGQENQYFLTIGERNDSQSSSSSIISTPANGAINPLASNSNLSARGRRTLHKLTQDEPFQLSPDMENFSNLPQVSPHSLVKRQLRHKRK